MRAESTHRGETDERPAAAVPLHRSITGHAAAWTIARRSTPSVGAHDDPVEREADDVAGRLIESLRSSSGPGPLPGAGTPGRIRRADDRVIRRVPRPDASWKASGLTWALGIWTQQAIDDEFTKVKVAWNTAQKDLDRATTSNGQLRRLSNEQRPGADALRDGIKAAKDKLKSFDRAITWDERSTVLTELTTLQSTIVGLKSTIATFKSQDQQAAEQEERQRQADQEAIDKENEAERVRQENRNKQELAKKAKEAKRAKQQQAQKEQRARDQLTFAELQKKEEAEREARRKEQEAEDERLAQEEQERKDLQKKAQQAKAGKTMWDQALEAAAVTTSDEVKKGMPDRFGDRRAQLLELERMLVRDRAEVEKTNWTTEKVTQMLGTKDQLSSRWTRHIRQVANQPRIDHETERKQQGQPAEFTLTRHQLWTYLGVPGARGASYEMRSFMSGKQACHLTLTGDAMNDPIELWKKDPTFLLQDPFLIVGDLFYLKDPKQRIHATIGTGTATKHVYYGSVNGNDTRVSANDYDGHAKALIAELDKFVDAVRVKLWTLKSKNWKV